MNRLKEGCNAMQRMDLATIHTAQASANKEGFYRKIPYKISKQNSIEDRFIRINEGRTHN